MLVVGVGGRSVGSRGLAGVVLAGGVLAGRVLTRGMLAGAVLTGRGGMVGGRSVGGFWFLSKSNFVFFFISSSSTRASLVCRQFFVNGCAKLVLSFVTSIRCPGRPSVTPSLRRSFNL